MDKPRGIISLENHLKTANFNPHEIKLIMDFFYNKRIPKKLDSATKKNN